MAHIHVLGAGLAGCEAAWQAAQRGVSVTLYEMKPQKYTPAHHSPGFAELVCSNSLRSDRVTNAVGLLKEELSRMGSLIMEAARATQVAAGSALAVDRDRFSAYITEKIKHHPLIEVVEGEVTTPPEEGITVIATGPLTSDPMAEWIRDNVAGEGLHFFDAVAPIVDFSSINMDVAFFASRYNKGDADYINCPMTREQYDAFTMRSSPPRRPSSRTLTATCKRSSRSLRDVCPWRSWQKEATIPCATVRSSPSVLWTTARGRAPSPSSSFAARTRRAVCITLWVSRPT